VLSSGQHTAQRWDEQMVLVGTSDLLRLHAVDGDQQHGLTWLLPNTLPLRSTRIEREKHNPHRWIRASMCE
jgi:hypothetical protein